MQASVVLMFALLPAVVPEVVNASQEAGLPAELAALRQQGSAQYAARQFVEAAGTFARCAEMAGRLNRPDAAIPCWNNAGGANLARMNFGPALDAFFRARLQARASGSKELEAVAESNLASIYLILGDAEEAAGALGQATSLLPEGSRYLAHLMGQRARLAFRNGDHAAVLPLLTQAIQAAEALGDHSLLALLWDDVAAFELNRNDLAAAEEALGQEFRVRLLFRPLHPEYAHIRAGRLKLAQGKPLEALAWFDRADALRRAHPGPYLPWVGIRDRSAALEAAGRIPEALKSIRQALRLAMDWRQEAEPGLSWDTAADVTAAEIATDFARLADAYSQDGTEIRAAFVAVEQARAAGLRHLILARPDLRNPLGTGYREALKQWRAAVQAAGQPPAAHLTGLQARLTEAEQRAGFTLAPHLSAPASGAGGLASLSESMRPDQALFSFLLAEPVSHLWTLSGTTLTHHRLPGRAALISQLDGFRAAVAGNSNDLQARASETYRTLFGSAPNAALAKRDWLLSLDDALLRTPLAALLRPDGTQPQWLGQARSLTVLPSAFWLLSKPAASAGSLLAVGDAIHNLADPRWTAHERARNPGRLPLSFWRWPLLQASVPASTIELPALPGSRREIEQVAALWRQAARPLRLLSGDGARQAQVDAELAKEPGIVHFATHVLPLERQSALFTLNEPARLGKAPVRVAVRRPDDAFLALSMTSSSSRDGILAGQVPSYHVPGSLIVLSGCSSGLGTIQPGAGLAGFTRAWIGAGARGVLSSLWPVDDDSGTFFYSFYRSLLSGSSSAKSLKAAQTAMILSKSWRAQPRYWAAYFLVGKE